MQVGVKSLDAAFGDLWTLVLVLLDPVEVFHVIGAAEKFDKVFIVGDYKQLEVTLLRATLDDSVKHTENGHLTERLCFV